MRLVFITPSVKQTDTKHLSGGESDIIVPTLLFFVSLARLSGCNETRANTFKREVVVVEVVGAVIHATDYAKEHAIVVSVQL